MNLYKEIFGSVRDRNIKTLNDFVNELNKIIKTISRNKISLDIPIKELVDDKSIYHALSQIRKLDLNVCYELEQGAIKDTYELPDLFVKDLVKNYLAKVVSTEPFCVSTTCVFKNGDRLGNAIEYKVLAYIVDAAINQWEHNNKKTIIGTIQPPYEMCVVRKTNNDVSKNNVPDNDHYELEQITNIICNKLLISDHPSSMKSVRHCTIHVDNDDEIGTDIYVYELKDVLKFDKKLVNLLS